MLFLLQCDNAELLCTIPQIAHSMVLLDLFYFFQVAEFIIKNAGEYQSEMAITDPFTG